MEQINTKGIGLGLHISKKITKKLGGDIYFNSKWGKGSTFSVKIQLDERKNDEVHIHRLRNPLV